MARRPRPAVAAGSPVVPGRTCVGCRERGERAGLLRVVAVEGALVPDPRRVLPGRGANVHPRADCLDLAERRRAWPRALRVPGPLDAAAVRVHVAHVALKSEQPSGKESTTS